MAAGEVTEIFVDYSLIGVSGRRFQTRVKAATRRRLHPGDTVVVHGDDVPPAWARVLAVADDLPDVELELLAGQLTELLDSCPDPSHPGQMADVPPSVAHEVLQTASCGRAGRP